MAWRNKTAGQYRRYVSEQESGRRNVLLAFHDGKFAGYLTVDWQSLYPPFRRDQTPEVTDFNVLPQFRRRGIGSRLMDEAERRIYERSTVAGIRVGLYSDYGAAQRLYVLRGYVPDGRGLLRDNQQVPPGDRVIADDSLSIALTKTLA